MPLNDKNFRIQSKSVVYRMAFAAFTCVVVLAVAIVTWPFALVWGMAKGLVLSTTYVALGVSNICLQLVQDNLGD